MLVNVSSRGRFPRLIGKLFSALCDPTAFRCFFPSRRDKPRVLPPTIFQYFSFLIHSNSFFIRRAINQDLLRPSSLRIPSHPSLSPQTSLFKGRLPLLYMRVYTFDFS